MVSWEKMCRLKKMEGFGFRKVKVINKVFIVKLVWRIILEEESLWIKVIR